MSVFRFECERRARRFFSPPPCAPHTHTGTLDNCRCNLYHKPLSMHHLHQDWDFFLLCKECAVTWRWFASHLDLLTGMRHSPCQAPQLSGNQRSAACQLELGCWVYLWSRRSVGVQPAAGPRGCCAGGSVGYLSGEDPQCPPPCCGGSAGWCLASSLVEPLGSAAEHGSELREGRKRQGCQNPKGGPRRQERPLLLTLHQWVRREGRLCRTRRSHVGKRRSVGAVAGRSASGHGPTLPCSPGHYGWFWTSRALTPTPSCRPPAPLGLLRPAPLDSVHYYPDPSETSSFTVGFY